MRVTKNILEAEGDQDEKRKLWFSENHVPLYMLREFEQNAGISSFLLQKVWISVSPISTQGE